MLLRIVSALVLIAVMVTAESSSGDLEEKPLVIVESIAVEEPEDVSPPAVAESRVGEADIGGVPDQLAVESSFVQRDYRAPPPPPSGHSIQAIPVPVPMKVIPGKLVIPAPPQNSQQSSGGYGGNRRKNPHSGPPPPPVFKPPFNSGGSAPHSNFIPPPPHRQVQEKYSLPPPPPPPNSYRGAPPPPPPPQNNYNPPAPSSDYNGPPPPPPSPSSGYGNPKQGDLVAGGTVGTSYNVPPVGPPPAVVYSQPPSPQNNYNAPPPAPINNLPPLPQPQQQYAQPQQPQQQYTQPQQPQQQYSQPQPQQQPPQQKYTQPQQPQQQYSQPQQQAPQLKPNYTPPKPIEPRKPVPVPVYEGPINNDINPAGLSIPDADVSGSAIIQPNAVVPSDPWPNSAPEMPKITALDVKCEKNLMKISLEFDKPFYGIIFSKGHYSNVNCVHLAAGLGRSQASFDISINACGTTGNTENGLYGYGSQSGSGTFFENTIVVQYDPQVQEVWDQARKLRCTWHDQYEKAVTFRPFPVDMLHVVPADFAGDNVGCWMQIQVGKGPWASEVSGLVKIGQTMTMVLAIKDDDNKFDMLVRNCMAHDGKRAPIQLVDQRGCVSRPKLMSSFTKIKNFGASASVLSYAYFQAFKFPDSMEVHFQCTIQICRYQCPDQCQSDSAGALPGTSYDATAVSGKRSKREAVDDAKDIGVNRIIQVVSTRDLTFIPEAEKEVETPTFAAPLIEDQSSLICMSTPGFAATLVVLLAILIVSCLLSAFLCLRFRGHPDTRSIISSYDNPVFMHKKGHF